MLTDEANLLKYGNDETEDFVFPPSVVVKPKTVSEVSQIMKFANTHLISKEPIRAQNGLKSESLSILFSVIKK